MSMGSVYEDAGAKSITVTDTLNGTSRTTDTTVTVAVGASGDTTVEGTDYTTVDDLTLTIDSGETSGTATFTLTPTDYDEDEDDETLSVTGTTTATDLSVTGTTATIVDDDERGLAVSATTLTVPEGGTATYTVVLESEPTATVTPSVSGDADVTMSPSSLSFSTGDWNTAKTVTVSAAQDADADDDEATVSHAMSGGDYGSETASGVGITVSDDDTESASDPPTVVPGNWALIPAGLGPGDGFRLLAKTKSPLKPDSISTDVADYNDYVQEQVRTRGHMAVQDYADDFQVLGSTAAVNVRTNTGTTGSGGVPIYWLNGERVADDYGDFYDGTWSNKNNDRGVAGDLITGNSSSARQLLCTGTADDGTTTDLPLGGGDPDNNGTSECTATSIAITSNTLGSDVLYVSGRARYLALSNVFQVGSTVVPTNEDVSISSNPGSDNEYATGDEIRITVTFSEAVLVTGNPLPALPHRRSERRGRPVPAQPTSQLRRRGQHSHGPGLLVHGEGARLRQGQHLGQGRQAASQRRHDHERCGRGGRRPEPRQGRHPGPPQDSRAGSRHRCQRGLDACGRHELCDQRDHNDRGDLRQGRQGHHGGRHAHLRDALWYSGCNRCTSCRVCAGGRRQQGAVRLCGTGG